MSSLDFACKKRFDMGWRPTLTIFTLLNLVFYAEANASTGCDTDTSAEGSPDAQTWHKHSIKLC